MPFVNALEPTSLERCFEACPPAGFRILSAVAGVPAFETRFDLTTTAEPGLQRFIRRLPGHRRWQSWHCPWTVFIGSTVSEYACLPDDSEPEALAESLLRAHGRERPFLIVKDLPVDSPLLPASDNRRNAAFAQALKARGFVLMEGQALAWVPLDDADEQAYLARLSRNARRDIRRKLRSRAALRIETLPTGHPAFEERAFLLELYALYRQVHAQSDIHFDCLSADFFAGVLRDGRSGGVLFVYRHRSQLIGWNLCFEHAGNLVDKYIGFAYPAAREHNLYAVSWMHNLEYARARRLRHYIAGWTDPEIKAHMGARFTWTRHAVRPRNALLRLALRRLSGHFERDSHWHRAHADERRDP